MALEPFIGEIMIFAGNFAPRGWAACSGQLLSIAQNTALFSILGTTYGGNGQTTFALPDLRGRVPMSLGQGPGLANRTLGELAGTESGLLTVNNLPSHTHASTLTASMPANSGAGNADTPNGNIPAGSASAENYAAPASANGTMAPITLGGTISPTGGNQPISLMQPYLVLTFCVALEGIFPSRN